MKRVHLRLMVCVLILAVVFARCANAEWFVHTGSAMTTEIHLSFALEDKQAAEQLIKEAMAEFKRIDQQYSSYKPQSLLSNVNLNAWREAIAVPVEFVYLLRRSIVLSELTGGAFDITFNSVGYQYDFRSNKRPDDKQISDALPLINYRHLKLDEVNGTVNFAREGVRIGLGGIAKGYAVERIASMFRQAGVRAAQITAGGDTRFIGDHNGKPWTIGVQDPRNAAELAAVIPVIDEAVSTSGDYARYFLEGGVRYHHIINPDTGTSANEVSSATVIGPDGVTTDALSTGIFVLGIEAGLALINRTDRYEAVLIDSFGKLHYSEAFSIR